MKRCTAITGSLFVVMLFASTAAATRAEPALRLVQKHNYWGETETIVSMHGVRIDNKGRMKYSLVARSPKWKVILFRDDDKTFFSQSLDKFERTGLISELVVKKYPRNVGRLVRNGKFKNLPTQRFSVLNVQLEVLPLANIAAEQVESIILCSIQTSDQWWHSYQLCEETERQ